MTIVCYSPKGGQGCTTVAVALAHLMGDAILIDFAGDAPAVAGVAAAGGPGICDALASNHPITGPLLVGLAVSAGPGTVILPAGHHPVTAVPQHRLAHLAEHLPTDRPVVIDAGTNLAAAGLPGVCKVMVVSTCYLALRRAVAFPVRPDRVVLVTDRTRALSVADAEAALGRHVDVTIERDPRVARAVDAGLLLGHLPDTLRRGLSPLTQRSGARHA